ncbi:hypothetical protein CXB51_021173 [Gossypium anomalum]|uniref:DUF7745 domain-containing protein n=1 Tax=Gossypium anomalum TaxID=47600 RepID=A0A8J5Y8X9_9ROSI|nr:hypothetical protein CXB51_021173 [Gossypium anomalum]
MENGFLDRVEGNADIHRWSEQTQLEKGDSITMGYVSELPDYTRITVDEHLFRALAQFWSPTYSCFTFGEVDLVPTVEEYTALLRCPRFQSDMIYSRAACVPTFWKKLMTITGMSEQWITARSKEKGECKCILWDALKDLILTHPGETKKVDIFSLSLYGLMVFPRALGYVDEATTDLFHRLSKRVTSVLAILVETFRSLGACRRAGAGRCAQLLLAWFYSHFRLINGIVCQVFFKNYSPLKDIVASSRKVDVPEENWIALLRNLQSKDVEWRAPWMVPERYFIDAHGLRQFVPATHGLAQSEFVYRGADYKRKGIWALRLLISWAKIGHKEESGLVVRRVKQLIHVRSRHLAQQHAYACGRPRFELLSARMPPFAVCVWDSSRVGPKFFPGTTG